MPRARAHRTSAIAAAAFAAVTICDAGQLTVDVLVDRLGAYLLDYETKVFELAADERFEQSIKRRPGWGQEVVARRKVESTFFLVRLPGGQAWYGFRDVSKVDGRQVPTPERPLAEILSQRTIDAYEEGLRITRENAKYNIGGVYRTINVPLQTLELLHPQFRERFDFMLAGASRVNGVRASRIDFAERVRPSLVSDGFGGDLMSSGSVWVEPDRGTVLRTELRLAGEGVPFLKDSLVRVDYRRDARLQIFLPVEMEETYGLEIEVVRSRATYRNYRRFVTGARLVPPD
jgi:hypothetical protein